MAGKGPLLDDMASLMTNAAGVAQGMRREAEVAVASWFERWLAERDLPTREEVDAVRDMARKAREENEALAARLAEIEETMAKCAALKVGGANPPPPSDAPSDTGGA